MVIVGRDAPDFTAPAVMPDGSIDENFNFNKYAKGNIAIMFFFPAAFTFVCPSEIIALDNRIDKFNAKGVKVIGCSVDTHFVNKKWREVKYEDGGIGAIKFPLVSDLGGNISRMFGILSDANLAYRATFLIDQTGKVVHQTVNDFPLGRDIDELLRMVNALKFFQENGDVCPAGWNDGKSGMKGSAEGVAEYLRDHAKDL